MPEINNDALTVHPFHSHSLISGAWEALFFFKKLKNKTTNVLCFAPFAHRF